MIQWLSQYWRDCKTCRRISACQNWRLSIMGTPTTSSTQGGQPNLPSGEATPLLKELWQSGCWRLFPLLTIYVISLTLLMPLKPTLMTGIRTSLRNPLFMGSKHWTPMHAIDSYFPGISIVDVLKLLVCSVINHGPKVNDRQSFWSLYPAVPRIVLMQIDLPSLAKDSKHLICSFFRITPFKSKYLICRFLCITPFKSLYTLREIRDKDAASGIQAFSGLTRMRFHTSDITINFLPHALGIFQRRLRSSPRPPLEKWREFGRKRRCKRRFKLYTCVLSWIS